LSKILAAHCTRTQAECIAKETVAEVLATLDEDTKQNKLKLLITLLKSTDPDGNRSLTSRFLWGGHSNEPSTSNEEKLFANMAVEILSVVTHACAVERINKSHGWIHSKARASMANHTTRKGLYIFTNECLLHKLRPDNRPKPIELTSFETFLVRNATAVDAEDILSAISNAPVADYLPAEREDRPAPSRRAPRRTSADDDDDGDDDVDMEEDDETESVNSLDEADGPGSSDDEEIDEDDGYIYLDEPTPPEGFENYEMPETAHFLNPSEITKGGWYLLLCIDDGSWWLGKIKSYSSRAKTWNFTIQWGCSEAPERQSVKLENYFRPASGEPAVSGNWVYLKQPRRASSRREREDDNAGSAGDKDEGDFEDDGDSDDDLGNGDSGETPRSRSRISESDGASSGGGGGGGNGGAGVARGGR